MFKNYKYIEEVLNITKFKKNKYLKVKTLLIKNQF